MTCRSPAVSFEDIGKLSNSASLIHETDRSRRLDLDQFNAIRHNLFHVAAHANRRAQAVGVGGHTLSLLLYPSKQSDCSQLGRAPGSAGATRRLSRPSAAGLTAID